MKSPGRCFRKNSLLIIFTDNRDIGKNKDYEHDSCYQHQIISKAKKYE